MVVNEVGNKAVVQLTLAHKGKLYGPLECICTSRLAASSEGIEWTSSGLIRSDFDGQTLHTDKFAATTVVAALEPDAQPELQVAIAKAFGPDIEVLFRWP